MGGGCTEWGIGAPQEHGPWSSLTQHTCHHHPTYRDEAAPAPYPAGEHSGPNKKLAKNHALFMSKSYLVNIIYQICLQDTQIDFYVNKFVIKYNKCCTVTPWQTCPDSYGGKFYLYLHWSTKWKGNLEIFRCISSLISSVTALWHWYDTDTDTFYVSKLHSNDKLCTLNRFSFLCL